jgi:hypothetical protein
VKKLLNLKWLNNLILPIAIALLTYGGWQHDRSRPLGEVWQIAQCHDGDTCTLTLRAIS